MKLLSTFIAGLISSVSAAPAIVWTAEKSSTTHSSDLIDVTTILSNVASSPGTSQYNLVFVVGRDASGSEGLTGLTSSGSLPNVSSKYTEASTVHHYVRGIESFDSIVKDAKASTSNVVESSLVDYRESMKQGSATEPAAAEGASSPKMIVVRVPADAASADIDAAVVSAIEDEKVGSVVLTGVRGLSEVKLERNANAKKNFYQMQYKATGRRRLEDNRNGNNNGNNNGSYDGIYFVNFTPNIFSGLLFMSFFMVLTYIGLGCMNMIAGQDVYVSKYPSIGREV
mmetsp:Transcript_4504/g.8664  ORF Transcript_4504/g.8664 Transcript_4504/m.8664 type:complete len:284 (+) Transcript_4504:254-1105(+)